MDYVYIDISTYTYTHTHKSINVYVAVIYLPLYFPLFEAFIKICFPPAEQDLVTYKYVWWHLALLKAAPLATTPRSERRSQVDFSALTRQASWGISPQTSYHRTCSLAHWWWVRAERLCAAFINKTSSLVLAFRCCMAAVKRKWASSILSSVCCTEIYLINFRLNDWNNIQKGQRPEVWPSCVFCSTLLQTRCCSEKEFFLSSVSVCACVCVCVRIFKWVNICASMCAYPGGDQESNECYVPQFLEIGPLSLAWSFHVR